MDVPRIYGNKSTIHRLHLELCRTGVYSKMFNEMVSRGYLNDRLNLSGCNIDAKDIPAKKGDIGYNGNKKVKGINVSAITDYNGLPVAIFISPANIHDSKLYIPTISRLKIMINVGRPITRPRLINADKAYDSEEIRNYNRNRGIISNIPINKRNRKNPKIGWPLRLSKEDYARRSVIERFFSWIEAFRKVYPRYERLEQSYLGLALLACSLILWRV